MPRDLVQTTDLAPGRSAEGGAAVVAPNLALREDIGRSSSSGEAGNAGMAVHAIAAISIATTANPTDDDWVMVPNDQLERPATTFRQAARSHNVLALAAPSAQVSRPLQALVRRPFGAPIAWNAPALIEAPATITKAKVEMVGIGP